MSRHVSRFVLALTLLAVMSWTVPITAAVTATDNDWSEWLGAPSPAECKIEPKSAEDFVYALATAASQQPVETVIPAQVASIEELPSGNAATTEEAAGALDTVRELVACLNAGSYGAVLALFSDSAFVQLMWGSGPVALAITEEDIAQTIGMIAPVIDVTPTPLAEDSRASLTEIREVRLLEDGRILVISVGSSPLANGLAFAILEKSGDRWLIGAFGSIGEPATPTPTT